MNTHATACSPKISVESILNVVKEFKLREEIRATIELAKKEGVVYVGPGIEDADLAEILPGVEIRHVPYMKKGQIVALDTSRLDQFRELSQMTTESSNGAK